MDRFIFQYHTPVLHYQYDDEADDSPQSAVTYAVAEAADVSPYDLPPIFEFVDPDAIDSLVHQDRGSHDEDTLLSFTFAEWTVFVKGNGHIRVLGGPNQLQLTAEFGNGEFPITLD